MGDGKVKVWARLGTTLWLDTEVAEKDIKQAIINALQDGDAQLDGETYFPDADENFESGLEFDDVTFFDKIKVQFTGKGE